MRFSNRKVFEEDKGAGVGGPPISQPEAKAAVNEIDARIADLEKQLKEKTDELTTLKTPPKKEKEEPKPKREKGEIRGASEDTMQGVLEEVRALRSEIAQAKSQKKKFLDWIF